MLELVKAALAEDIGKGDLTSLACLEPDPLKAEIVAKSSGVLSGVEPAKLAFEIVDSANEVDFVKEAGGEFEKGDTIARIDGFNQTVLSSERVALNFLGRLSGIATLTAEFVERSKGARVLDTRKTTPGWRYLEKCAVLHGGGSNHRFGLYDMILIKDNHIASAGSITKAVDQARAFLDTGDFRLQFEADADQIQIEVEVTSEAELTEAIEVGVNRLLLDNQPVESLANLVAKAREINAEVELEASGNVTLDTVAAIAATGVDFISIGALTHSAPTSDFSLRVTE
ncbi:MAG: carboxylating nicotinate-nucleotide diphosphorylase [bacterium]|nr:carboxylating nicotinate-nucleotide diphosphorylase [bacterium]